MVESGSFTVQVNDLNLGMSENYQRMIRLANETFQVHNDPLQLDVDEVIIERLQNLHPATLSQYTEGDGPVIWVLLIPTTTQIMNDFISEKIGENEMLDRTKPGNQYDCIYLCSALTLPEFRNKGLTRKLTIEAIEKIKKDHPIKNLFVWNFSKEGEWLSNAIALQLNLPLTVRTRKIQNQ